MLDKLNKLTALSGGALEAALQVMLHDPDLQRYMMAVMDPSVTYGQKGNLKPQVTDACARQDLGDMYALLGRLASRELTGNAAKAALAEFCRTSHPNDVDLLNRALNKDLRCGVGTTTINKLNVGGFRIPVFEVALCQPAEEKRFKHGSWVAGLKYDGMRNLIDVNDNRVQFFTRSGKQIPALQPFEKAILEQYGGQKIILDSEAVGKTFLQTMSQLRRTKTQEANIWETTDLQIFDVLDRGEFYRYYGRDQPFGMALKDRLEQLAALGSNPEESIRLVEHLPVQGWHHAKSLADLWIEEGEEGGIFRRLEAQYSKARTHDWLKIKLEDTYDVSIVDIYEGEPGKQFEGMLGGVIVDVDGVDSDVGGGWSNWERAAIWAAHSNAPVPYTYVDIAGVEQVEVVQPDPANRVIGRTIEIMANGKNPSGALRHARKIRFRDVEGEKA